MADVTTTLKDAAYVTVGLGVLGFQRAQVHRVELMKQLAEQRRELAQDLDVRLAPVRQRVEERLDAFEDLLPDHAREIVHQARTAARETQVQLRSRLGLAPSATSPTSPTSPTSARSISSASPAAPAV